jgi:hypothetical protein
VLDANAYCETAMAAGAPLNVNDWMRGPVNICGLTYETACDGAFIGTSIEYVSSAGACEAFTEGDYERAWDRTRNQTCDYQNRP